MRGSFNGPQRQAEVKTPVGRQKIEQIMADRPRQAGGKHRR